MPGRLDTVEVATSRRNVPLSWASRDKLLDEVSHLESGPGIRGAFEAVGASRPVQLAHHQQGDLMQLIDHWTTQLANGHHDLPEGVWELRNALHDEPNDT